MDADDLLRFIESQGIEAEIVHLAVETPTVDAAAKAVGVLPEQIGKSILFLADGEPILIIANGTTRIDYKALAKYLGMSRKRIRLADSSQVSHFTGYQVGTVPPFGHKSQIDTVIEQSLIELNDIYAGGGEINVLLRIKTSELHRATGAEIVELRQASGNG